VFHHHRRRRGFAVRLLSFIARVVRILLMAFAAAGPAPPPPEPKGRDRTEQRSEARSGVKDRR
jgi:hypothetical protein